jgi:hypothetical protein
LQGVECDTNTSWVATRNMTRTGGSSVKAIRNVNKDWKKAD